MSPKPNEKSVSEDDKFEKEEMSGKIKEILKLNGITDTVSEVIVKDAGLKGEGFASLAEYVIVKFEDPGKPLNLFVKILTDNPSHTQMLTEMKAFEKEATFLTDYCKAAKEMCKLKGFPNFIDFYPKCYFGDGKMIVLENLVLDKGYSLKSKEERQDLESAKFSVTTLAKHHAISHVMINEIGGPEKFFKKFPHLDLEAMDKPSMIEIMDGMCNNAVESNRNILLKNDVTGAMEAANKLVEYIGKPMSIMVDAVKNKKAEGPVFRILNHGDYWNNNMMFLVDGPTKKIVHHVAIDFQITRYNTPALDLTYFFYTSVQPRVRRAHLLDLLNLYKDTLNKVSEDFGHPTNLTLDQIFRDFRKKLGYGYWLGFVTSVGPGVGLLKDIDVSKVDLKDWPAIMEELLNKWISENPEKGKETAEELVKLVQEYGELKI